MVTDKKYLEDELRVIKYRLKEGVNEPTKKALLSFRRKIQQAIKEAKNEKT
jgi:hypothetical protein